MKKLGLLPKLILGIIVGSAFGLMVGKVPDGTLHSILFFVVRVFSTFNELFGEFLSFLVPLIILSLVTVGLGDLGHKANKLFGITVAISYISSICAGFLAYFAGYQVLPKLLSGVVLTTEQIDNVMAEPYFSIEMPQVVPIMSALVLSFIIGLGIANIKGTTLANGFRDFKDIITLVLDKIIIPLIPFHVCGLFMKMAVGGELFATIKLFASIFITIIILQYIFVFIQFVLACSYSNTSILKSYKSILPAYFTALGTQSSAATIPVSVECAKNNGSDEDIVDFVIPLCANIHLAGDTIAITLGSMGILLTTGGSIDLQTFFPFILMLGITMVAAPGIPGGGAMASLGILEKMLSFTTGMQNLIITTYFVQDSFGTGTNISGDQAICLVINKINKQQGNSDTENNKIENEVA